MIFLTSPIFDRISVTFLGRRSTWWNFFVTLWQVVIIGKFHPFPGKGNTWWISSVIFYTRSKFCECKSQFLSLAYGKPSMRSRWGSSIATFCGRCSTCWIAWIQHILGNAAIFFKTKSSWPCLHISLRTDRFMIRSCSDHAGISLPLRMGFVFCLLPSAARRFVFLGSDLLGLWLAYSRTGVWMIRNCISGLILVWLQGGACCLEY